MKRLLDKFFMIESEELRRVKKHFIILRSDQTVGDNPSWRLRVGDWFVTSGTNNAGDILVLCRYGVLRATNSAVHHYSEKIA